MLGLLASMKGEWLTWLSIITMMPFAVIIRGEDICTRIRECRKIYSRIKTRVGKP